MLRTLLSDLLELEPSTIKFECSAAGKPILAASLEQPHVHFSLSHSGGVALIALANGRRVGVDVELINLGRDISDLADHALAEVEHAGWKAGLKASQRKIFYRYWVRKEAYLEGIGSGFSFPDRRVDVSSTRSLPIKR